MNMFKKIFCVGMTLALVLSLGFAAMASGEFVPEGMIVDGEILVFAETVDENAAEAAMPESGEAEASQEITVSSGEPMIGTFAMVNNVEDTEVVYGVGDTEVVNGAGIQIIDENLDPESVAVATSMGGTVVSVDWPVDEDLAEEADDANADDADADEAEAKSEGTVIAVSAFDFPGCYTGSFTPVLDYYEFTVSYGTVGSDVLNNPIDSVTVTACRNGDDWEFSSAGYRDVEFLSDSYNGTIIFRVSESAAQAYIYAVVIGNCLFYLDRDAYATDVDTAAEAPVADGADDVQVDEVANDAEAGDAEVGDAEVGEAEVGDAEVGSANGGVDANDGEVISTGIGVGIMVFDENTVELEDLGDTIKAIFEDVSSTLTGTAEVLSVNVKDSKDDANANENASANVSLDMGSAVLSTDGASEGGISPKTGDTTPIAIYVGIIVVLAAMVAICVCKVAKNKKNGR